MTGSTGWIEWVYQSRDLWREKLKGEFGFNYNIKIGLRRINRERRL